MQLKYTITKLHRGEVQGHPDRIPYVAFVQGNQLIWLAFSLNNDIITIFTIIIEPWLAPEEDRGRSVSISKILQFLLEAYWVR